MPGSGIHNKALYPRTNTNLADDIVRNNGCLISEYAPDTKSESYMFPQRNRLMAGLCKATLVIEAAEKSGTLITARMALDYNRDVLAVPGSVFSPTSIGANRLIRNGATPITNSTELLDALGFVVVKEEMSDEERYKDCTKDEMAVIEILREPMERDELIRSLSIDTARANALLSMMEIKELIREELGEMRRM